MKTDELENAHRIVMAGVYGEKSSGAGQKNKKKGQCHWRDWLLFAWKPAAAAT